MGQDRESAGVEVPRESRPGGECLPSPAVTPIHPFWMMATPASGALLSGKPRQPLSYQESFTFRANRPPTERAGGRSHRPEIPPGT